jgi:hypothetical protein
MDEQPKRDGPREAMGGDDDEDAHGRAKVGRGGGRAHTDEDLDGIKRTDPHDSWAMRRWAGSIGGSIWSGSGKVTVEGFMSDES